MSKLLIGSGYFFIIAAVSSAIAYWSKIFPFVQRFAYAAMTLAILAATVAILFDESIGNLTGTSPTWARGGGIALMAAVTGTIVIYGFALPRPVALQWLALVAVALVLLSLAILGVGMYVTRRN